MQECRTMNPAEVEKVFRFPRTLARKKTLSPAMLSQQGAGHCLLAMQDLE